MGRYSRNNSTYTLRKRAQDINNGLITERDWSTVTGGYFRYSKGKRIVYADSNFIFTTSNVQLPSKRNRPTDEAIELTYNNVENSKNIVNDVSLNTESNDIRSFAYYGSCVELIENSISNIIATFPACIYKTDNVLQFPVDDEFIDVTEDGKVTVGGTEYIVVDGKVTVGGTEYTVLEDKVTINGKEYTVEDGKVTVGGKKYTIKDYKVTIGDKEYTIKDSSVIIDYPVVYKVTIKGKDYTVVGSKVIIDGVEYTIVNGIVTIQYPVVYKITINGKDYTVEDGKVTVGSTEYTVVDGKVTVGETEYAVVEDKITINGKDYTVVDGTVIVGGTNYTVVDGKVTIDYTVINNKVTINGKEYTVVYTVTIDGIEYTVVDGMVTVGGTEYTVVEDKVIINGNDYTITNGTITIKYTIKEDKVTINGKDYTVVDGKVTIGGTEYAVEDGKVTIVYPLTYDKVTIKYTIENGKTTIGSNEYIIDECKVLYKLSNPFAINLLDEKELFSEYENPMRYIRESFDDYLINDVPIDTYRVELFLDDCYEKNQWYYNESDKKEQRYIVKITINGHIIIYGYQVGKDIVYMSANNIIIKPKDEIIEEYFDNLNGFERQLLNRKSKPLYSNTFITPVEGDLSYKYVNRIYTWPTVCGYCPDIESVKYGSFIEKLLNMATIYDELWCDNLYGRMTHEAIKNFDWTYTRDYIDGEEQDNIDGGNMMQKILHLIGRIFDDIKNHSDGIKYSNNVSYSGFNNMPLALLSDKAEMLGWDTKSIISPDVVDNSGIISLNEDDFINKNNIKWYNATNVDSVNTATADIEFMKRLLLSTNRIFSSKGTQESIEMVMALFGLGRDVDYTLKEQSYIAEAKKDTDDLEDLYRDVNERYSWTENGNGDYDTVITAFSNVTLNTIFFKGENYIIPFYDKNEIYANDVYFEGKGGWGNYDDGKDYKNKYLETVSYLNVVADIKSLTQVSSMSVKKGDIYYVVNLEDYPITYDSDGSNVTHFFYFESDNHDTEKIDKWKNISKDDLDNRSTEEADRARYLYDIINTNLGNNPHIGYGRYDNGQDYLNKMSKPFEYKLYNIPNYEDPNNVNFKFKINTISNDDKTHNAIKTNENNENNSGNELINKITIDYTVKNNKVTINSKDYTVEEGKVTFEGKEYPAVYKVTIGETEYTVVDGTVTINGKEYAVKDGKVTFEGKEYPVVYKVTIVYTGVNNKITINGVEYTVEDGKVTINDKEYTVEKGLKLNSKVFIIQNNIDNEYFKKYLKETIIPYVLQVIPSTTILKLENFN